MAEPYNLQPVMWAFFRDVGGSERISGGWWLVGFNIPQWIWWLLVGVMFYMFLDVDISQPLLGGKDQQSCLQDGISGILS